jgi:hypothetical protein
MMRAAHNNLFHRRLFAESWVPSWSQSATSPPQTDANSYEGLGNCDWQTLDFIWQTLTATTLWASANGLSEVNFFSAANTPTASKPVNFMVGIGRKS